MGEISSLPIPSRENLTKTLQARLVSSLPLPASLGTLDLRKSLLITLVRSFSSQIAHDASNQ